MLRTVLFTAVALLFCAPAMAQDGEKPYAPLALQPQEVINFPGYDRSPIKLEFEELRRERQLNGERLDFKHIYAVPFAEMVAYFETAFREKRKLPVVDPESYPWSDSPELNVVGVQADSEPARFSFGHPSIPGRITVDIVSEGNGSAVIVHNAIFSRIYSGVMPVRAPYTPRGADPIGFRWN